MKIGIRQDVLSRALERGAIAALSDEAQNDTSNLSLLIKSVKITANTNNIVFESATNLLAVRHVVTVDDANSIEIKETGSVLILAKEFYAWVGKQKGCNIGISLSKLDSPEKVEMADDSDVNSQYLINKIGTVKFTSKDVSKSGSKWSLDCFDPEQAPSIKFGNEANIMANLLFGIPPSQLLDGIKNISFASLPKHCEHVFDSLLVEMYDNNVHISSCDMTRSAIYKLDKASGVGGILSSNGRILLPCSLISTVTKLLSKDDDVSVYYNESNNRVYLSQKDLDFRIAIADRENQKKFPSVSLLLNKKYTESYSLNKSILTSRLSTASLVNKSTVLCKFRKDDSDFVLTIKSASDNGMSPSINSMPIINISNSDQFYNVNCVLSIGHLNDVSKIIHDENVIICFPKDGLCGSVKILNASDNNFSYYSMTVKNSKYDLNEKD